MKKPLLSAAAAVDSIASHTITCKQCVTIYRTNDATNYGQKQNTFHNR